jgi:hypothetical protein
MSDDELMEHLNPNRPVATLSAIELEDLTRVTGVLLATLHAAQKRIATTHVALLARTDQLEARQRDLYEQRDTLVRRRPSCEEAGVMLGELQALQGELAAHVVEWEEAKRRQQELVRLIGSVEARYESLLAERFRRH